MEKTKKSKAVIILSVILGLSVLLNLLLFFTIGTLDMEWQNDYTNLDIEWCEVLNRENDLVNDLIDTLEYYSPEFESTERMEIQDCWG